MVQLGLRKMPASDNLILLTHAFVCCRQSCEGWCNCQMSKLGCRSASCCLHFAAQAAAEADASLPPHGLLCTTSMMHQRQNVPATLNTTRKHMISCVATPRHKKVSYIYKKKKKKNPRLRTTLVELEAGVVGVHAHGHGTLSH